ncbi:TRAP transporter substrate-binding protein [Thiohalocapsa sp. ML1]|uniref:TRAP transporter substrate-binding protein n=1 Tax=Thiohalocapsa sp. ML1 TaxID=1431688 RepID=UPI0007323FB9|nr:TRAP transporter substrate-binding protein [Thiohalocapsa sp. ML1]
MQRRTFITGAAGATAAAAALGSGSAWAKPEHKWKMVTTWPKNFPGLGTGANKLAELIGTLSGGRIEVKVFGAGELVPAFEVFDAVSSGTAEIGHGAAYYWKGKSEAAQFFSSVPYGLTAQEMNGWLYHGGGLELWTELYAGFGLVPAPAGNTGVQMGGWFNKEINSVADLEGLKMRIPGLGGEVLRRAGGTPVNLPGGELFTALQSGTIDATEWVGPYNDLAFGLYKAAKYYYYPGWQEPGTTLEAMVNKKVFDGLPKDLQAIVLNACKVLNQDMLAEYTARNPAALRTLVTEHGVDLRKFPDDVIVKLRELSDQVVAEIADKDAFSQKTYASYRKFLTQAKEWSAIAELTYLKARDET